MNQLYFAILAFIGGIFLAAQGVFNSHLGVLLKNPLFAAIIAFFSSTLFALLFILVLSPNLPNSETIKNIPTYLWFTGGLFSVLGITLYYYTIPKLGVSTMISLGLTGQVIFSMIAGHFGFMNLPVEPITIKKLIGMTSMITGIFLINFE